MVRTVALLAACLLTLAALPARALTIVPGGNLGTQSWTLAGSPYIVQGDVTIAAGATLTIQSGVAVRMASGDSQAGGQDATRAEIRVSGSLVVGNDVQFVADGAPLRGAWYGIHVLPAAENVALGANVQIRHAVHALRVQSTTAAQVLDGIVISDTSACALRYESGSPVLRNANLASVQSGLCVVGSPGGATVENFELDRADQDGIYGVTGIDYQFRNLRIRRAAIAVTMVAPNSQVLIEGALLFNNQQGIVLQNAGMSSIVRNVTVTNNPVSFYIAGANNHAQVFNSNVTFNQFGPFTNFGGTAEFIHSNIFGNVQEVIGNGFVSGPGMISEDPLYVQAFSNFDYTSGGDFHLTPQSPSANHGLNAASSAVTDVEGNPRRFQNGTVDMGALELQQPAFQTISFQPFGDRQATDPPFQLQAAASSGLPVTFTSQTPMVCTVVGDIVTLVGRNGVCVIEATQPGNLEYIPVFLPVTQSGFILGAVPNIQGPTEITFGSQVAGTPFTPVQATVTNAGYAPLSYSVNITGAHPADFGVNVPCALLQELASCQIQFTFTPSATGNRLATALIASNDPDTPLLIVPLSGTSIAADTTPNAFTFTDQASVARSVARTSNAITVAGINTPAPISVTGGTYSIGCTAMFTGAAGTIANGQTVCVRHTSSASFSTATNTVLTIGGVSDTFTSTTLASDTTPNAFSFADVLGVTPGAVLTSNAITVGGINTSASIAVTGGSYSIGCGATFTSAAGTIASGQTVCVRHTAPLGLSATTNTVLTIGGVSDTFSSTTITSLPGAGDFDGDGIPNGIEAAETRNPFVKDNDVFGNARLFAMQQYRDFLGREGEPSGIAFYDNLITSGTTRVPVIESFLASPEFLNGLPQCTRLYFSFFGRIPDYGGLLFQVNAFRQGVALDVIAQNFSNSPEFTSRYGALTDDQYINLVYQNVLGRAPDPAGYSFYFTHLQNGTLTRGAMMIGFSESPEFQQLVADEVFVVSVYLGMLRRTPEPAGLDFYIDLLEGGTPRSAIINGFFLSPEYHNRFLP